jgi:hypothetical protein
VGWGRGQIDHTCAHKRAIYSGLPGRDVPANVHLRRSALVFCGLCGLCGGRSGGSGRLAYEGRVARKLRHTDKPNRLYPVCTTPAPAAPLTLHHSRSASPRLCAALNLTQPFRGKSAALYPVGGAGDDDLSETCLQQVFIASSCLSVPRRCAAALPGTRLLVPAPRTFASTPALLAWRDA